MNPVIEELESAIAKYQDEVLADAEKFRVSLEAFRKTQAAEGSEDYLTLYGQLYADLTQLKNSAESVQEYMDQADDLKAVLEAEAA